MKNLLVIAFFSLIFTVTLNAGNMASKENNEKDIHAVVANYLHARETGDTTLLKSILTQDMDQLVSTGEWRYGKKGAMKGMMGSSEQNPGKRTLTVKNVRFLSPEIALADARYIIQNADGSERKMWSTFIVIYEKNSWKITALRNMKPAN
jgi:uncharacterized protein (TIGR02246 family)